MERYEYYSKEWLRKLYFVKSELHDMSEVLYGLGEYAQFDELDTAKAYISKAIECIKNSESAEYIKQKKEEGRS